METVKRSINIRHLFWKVVEKWKVILIAAIIGCIAGAGYAILKQKMEDKNLPTNQSKTVLTEISVTAEELANIYSMASLYDLIQAQIEYSKQSIWMKCQNLTKGVAKATYQIQAETDLEERQVATLYTDILGNNENYNEIALQEEMRVEYVREGIAYSTPADGILRLEITSYSKEKAQDWLEKIEKILDLQKKELETKTGISFDIKKVYHSTTETFDMGLADRQKTYMANITTSQTNYGNLIAEMPLNQQQYLTFHLQSRDNEDYVAGQSFKKEIPLAYKNRLKIDSILGFVFGAFVVGLFFILKYMYSPVLVNAEELNMMYDLSILGEIKKYNKGKGKKNDDIDSIQDNTEEYKKIIARIGIQNVKGEKIYIAGTQINETYMKLLEQEGKKQDISIVLGRDFIRESEAMIELRNCDAVIFMEEEGKSKYMEIEEEIKICKESDKKIMGVIVV